MSLVPAKTSIAGPATAHLDLEWGPSPKTHVVRRPSVPRLVGNEADRQVEATLGELEGDEEVLVADRQEGLQARAAEQVEARAEEGEVRIVEENRLVPGPHLARG